MKETNLIRTKNVFIMVIVGAGGFAKELLEVFKQKGATENLAFYDDLDPDNDKALFNMFPILKNELAVREFFKQKGNQFTIGIGNPLLRYKMYRKFVNLGGKLTSAVSPKACIGSFDVRIGDGCNILDGAVFSNCSEVGMGCIVYYNVIITHNCKIGGFVQLSPGVCLLGGVVVSDFTFIGANATVLPNLKIGMHSIISAGAVITKPVADYALMIGNPASLKGWVSAYGNKLAFDDNGEAICKISGEKYLLHENNVHRLCELPS